MVLYFIKKTENSSMNNILLLILSVILYLLSILISSHLINILSALMLLLFFIYMIKNNKDFTSMALMFFYGYITTSIVSVIAEFGVCFTEIHQFSHLTGAAARNSSLCFFTLFAASISFNCINNSNIYFLKFKKNVNFLETTATTFLYFLFVLSLFYIYFNYGHPNDYGVDRFDYWSNIAPRWGSWIKGITEIWMIALGRGFYVTKHKKYVIFFMFGILSFYLVGDKFTSLINSSIFFLMPILLLSKRNLFEHLSFKNILVIIACVILVLFIAFLSYYAMYKDIGLAMQSLITRISLQAQMWWAIDNISTTTSKSFIQIYNHFLGFSSSLGDNGIYYLMKLVTPDFLYDSMISNGVTFTMAYPVNLLYFFGYLLAPIVSTVAGLGLGVFLGIISKAIKGSGFVVLIVSAFIIAVLMQILFMGRNYFVTSIRFIFSVTILFLFLLLSRIKLTSY